MTRTAMVVVAMVVVVLLLVAVMVVVVVAAVVRCRKGMKLTSMPSAAGSHPRWLRGPPLQRLLVLHDPRNPDHVKEGVTCESIKGLKWMAKRLLTHVDMVSHVGPGGFKGIEPLANVDHAWSKNGGGAMPFFPLQPAPTTTTELLDTLRLQGGQPPLLKHVTLLF